MLYVQRTEERGGKKSEQKKFPFFWHIYGSSSQRTFFSPFSLWTDGQALDLPPLLCVAREEAEKKRHLRTKQNAARDGYKFALQQTSPPRIAPKVRSPFPTPLFFRKPVVTRYSPFQGYLLASTPFFLPAAIADRSRRASSCCFCWGTVFVSPLDDLVAKSHTNNLRRFCNFKKPDFLKFLCVTNQF